MRYATLVRDTYRKRTISNVQYKNLTSALLLLSVSTNPAAVFSFGFRQDVTEFDHRVSSSAVGRD